MRREKVYELDKLINTSYHLDMEHIIAKNSHNLPDQQVHTNHVSVYCTYDIATCESAPAMPFAAVV